MELKAEKISTPFPFFPDVALFSIEHINGLGFVQFSQFNSSPTKHFQARSLQSPAEVDGSSKFFAYRHISYPSEKQHRYGWAESLFVKLCEKQQLARDILRFLLVLFILSWKEFLCRLKYYRSDEIPSYASSAANKRRTREREKTTWEVLHVNVVQ